MAINTTFVPQSMPTEIIIRSAQPVRSALLNARQIAPGSAPHMVPLASSFHQCRPLAGQHGMGAAMILFTIALIVLAGAALAYASRGNASLVNSQQARAQAAVVLKQAANYRDAYNRYVYDGNSPATVTFDTTPSTGLFLPSALYGTYLAPPPQAMNGVAVAQWLFNKSIVVNNIGTAASDTIAYVPDVASAVCGEVNNQLYGTAAIPTSGAQTVALMAGSVTPIDSVANATNRPIGCFKGFDNKYFIFAALGEY